VCNLYLGGEVAENKEKTSKENKSTNKKSNFNIRNFLLYFAPVIVIAISAVVIAFYLPGIYAAPLNIQTIPATQQYNKTMETTLSNQTYKADYEKFKNNLNKADEEINKIKNEPGFGPEGRKKILSSEENIKIARNEMQESLQKLATSQLDKNYWDDLYSQYKNKIQNANQVIDSKGYLTDEEIKASEVDYATLYEGGQKAIDERKKELGEQLDKTTGKEILNCDACSNKAEAPKETSTIIKAWNSIKDALTPLTNPVCVFICRISEGYIQFLLWIVDTLFKNMTI